MLHIQRAKEMANCLHSVIYILNEWQIKAQFFYSRFFGIRAISYFFCQFRCFFYTKFFDKRKSARNHINNTKCNSFKGILTDDSLDYVIDFVC